jgi:hypothetical protein
VLQVCLRGLEGGSPRAHASNFGWRDSDNETCWWVVHGWELGSGANVDLGKIVQQFWGSAFGDRSGAFDYEVVGHSELIALSLNGE